jgi:hypothetical protein
MGVVPDSRGAHCASTGIATIIHLSSLLAEFESRVSLLATLGTALASISDTA